MKDLQMAWRNLWRNKRRTMITAASVFFAVFFALVMRSFQLGAYDRMFKNIIESYSGYLQLQHKDYFDEPSIDNSFSVTPEVMEAISSDMNVEVIVPRLESFALAAAGSRTQGVIVMGIDPEKEPRVSDIKSRLLKYRLTEKAVEELKKETLPERTKNALDVFLNESFSGPGRLMIDLGIADKDSSVIMPLLRKHAGFANNYFNSSDLGKVLIGNALSEYLKAGIGDTLVLVGQGYHGTSAAGCYVIKGIVKLPAPDIDNKIVYMTIGDARQLYAAPEMSTSVVLSLHDNKEESVLNTAGRLGKFIPADEVFRNWKELNALLINQMDADNKSGMIMIGILYLVIAFGVFGTVLMMLAERTREFGMLVSIGMQKRKLAIVVTMELLFVGFLGIIAGVIASLPVVFYGNIHPIRFTGEMGKMYEDYGFDPVMPTMLPDNYYLWQVFVVLLILLIAVIFSTRKIFRINVTKSLRA